MLPAVIVHLIATDVPAITFAVVDDMAIRFLRSQRLEVCFYS